MSAWLSPAEDRERRDSFVRPEKTHDRRYADHLQRRQLSDERQKERAGGDGDGFQPSAGLALRANQQQSRADHGAHGCGEQGVGDGLRERIVSGEIVSAGEPDNEHRRGNGDGEYRRQRPAESEDVPARGRAERETVGAGRTARQPDGDGEFFGTQPGTPVELALQDRDGGVAAAEDGDADAEEEAGDFGQAWA